ncbi:ABC transporter substrate-binding protein [Actinocorallia populi]|uniref:ABC transporter substrate-binding protein n=1 Tax=Actinocorallia populi TaxID=2079200 RepID=UPI000D0932C9|nr:ABC transporter substrate-binding protein [Actinocorallia populi]
MSTPSPSVRPRSRLLAAFAATALLATAACGGSDSSSKSAGTQELALAIQGTPPSLEITQLNGGQSAYIWSALYDTLLYTDNQGRIQPNAAESHTYSEDRRTLTLKLRKGMTFSSGAPVDAAAVKASLERILRTPGPNQSAMAAVEAVEAPDAGTVVIELERPDGALLGNLSFLNGVIADPATMTGPAAAADPVGSGPYTLDKGATVTGSTYVLKKREDYWNAAAYPFETVKVRVMADRSAVTNALQAGELNAGSVDFTQLQPLKAKGMQITSVEATAVASLVLADRGGETAGPLGDLRVRKAINMAFDRAKLAETFLRGSGRPTAQVFSPKGGGAHDPQLDETYPHDIAAAKKLLAEAGHPDGFSVTMPSLAITKMFEPTIAQSLADIGVKVNWTPVPPQQQAAALSSKKYPMYFMIDGLAGDAASTVVFFTPRNQRNPFASTDPELAKLIDEANKAADPAAAAEAYRKVNKFAVDNAWFAPVFYIGSTWVTAEGVRYLGDGSSTYSQIRAFGTGG